jgi:putative transposase
MRKEPFSVNNYVHVYNRGNRKQPIVHDTKDKKRFLETLFYFNTEVTPPNFLRDITQSLLRSNLNRFEWPEYWQPRKPIVSIIAFVLMENHFHLLLKEIIEGGIARFMQRFGTGITMYYNTKYQESGKLFHGSYKARCVNDDIYLKYLSVYIQIKNTFELYPGGLKKATKEFNKAYNWAIDYPYCSLRNFIGKNDRGIIDRDIFLELFSSPKEFKEFAYDCMLGMDLEDKLGDLALVEV